MEALPYFDDVDRHADAESLVRRLGILCLCLGCVWIVTYGYAAALSFNLLVSSTGPLTGWRYQLPYVTLFTLSIALAVGGAMSILPRPIRAARVVLLAFAIGTVTVGVASRLVMQFSGTSFPPTYVLASTVSGIALTAALPLGLLIVLRLPSIRAVYH